MLFYVDVMHDVSSQVYIRVLSRVTGSVSIQPTSNVCLKSFFKTYLLSIKICQFIIQFQMFTVRGQSTFHQQGTCRG